MKRALLLLVLLGGLWLLPTPAMALVCNASISDFNFGRNVTPDGSTTSSVLHWQCNRVTTPPEQTLNIRMCLFISEGARPGVEPRRLKRDMDPNIFIEYDLFADSALTQIVGPSGSSYPPFSFTLQLPAGLHQGQGTVPIYGRIYPSQDMLPFEYSDSDLVITPVRASYNMSASAPSVDECLNGGGDGTGTSTQTDAFVVQAHVANTCYISTATDLEFGQVIALDSDRDQTSTITLHCPWQTSIFAPWQVGLDDGLNAAGGIRRMAGPGNAHITYELYRDSGRTQRWGNTPDVDTVAGFGDSTLQSLTVYGRVPAQPTPAGGTYSDTITVTLTF